MSKEITNIDIGVYFNIQPSNNTPSFRRCGDFFENFTDSFNGKTESHIWINQKNGTTKRTGMDLQWAASGIVADGDPVNDYLVGCAYNVGNDVETSMLIVQYHKGVTASGVTTYPAKKFSVMIDVSSCTGLEGGSNVKFDCTIHANGDPVNGSVTLSAGDIATFTPTTQETVATPVIALSNNNSASVSLFLGCETNGATIKYTTDNTDPATSATANTFSTLVTLSTAGTHTIRAVATKSGLATSDEVSAVAVVTAE